MKKTKKGLKNALAIVLVTVLVSSTLVSPFGVAHTAHAQDAIDVIGGAADLLGIPIPDAIRSGLQLLDGCDEFSGLQDALSGAIDAGLGAVGSFIDENAGGILESLEGTFEPLIGAAASAIPVVGPIVGGIVGNMFGGGEDGGGEVIDTQQNEKERCLDALAQEAALNILQDVSDDVLDFLRLGFEAGNPAIVTNLQERLIEIANREFGRLIQSSDTFRGICEQYLDVIQSSVVVDFFTEFEEANGNFLPADFQLPEASTCKLETVLGEVGGDIDLCLAGDFTQCRWEGFRILVNDPNSNPLLAGQGRAEDIFNKIQIAQDTEEQEIQAGGGFLSDKRCNDGIPVGALGLCCTNGDSPILGVIGQEVDGTIINNIDQLLDDIIISRTVVGSCADGLPPTRQPFIATPASIIGDLANRIIGSDFFRIENVDEQNEVVSELADLLVGGVTRVGLLFAPRPDVARESVLVNVGLLAGALWNDVLNHIDSLQQYALQCENIQEMTGIPDPTTRLTLDHPIESLERSFFCNPATGTSVCTGEQLGSIPSEGIVTQDLVQLLTDVQTDPSLCVDDITADPSWSVANSIWLPNVDEIGNRYQCSEIGELIWGDAIQQGTSVPGGLTEILWGLASPLSLEERAQGITRCIGPTGSDPIICGDLPLTHDDGTLLTESAVEALRAEFTALVGQSPTIDLSDLRTDVDIVGASIVLMYTLAGENQCQGVTYTAPPEIRSFTVENNGGNSMTAFLTLVGGAQMCDLFDVSIIGQNDQLQPPSWNPPISPNPAVNNTSGPFTKGPNTTRVLLRCFNAGGADEEIAVIPPDPN